jgi:hypothetical protein
VMGAKSNPFCRKGSEIAHPTPVLSMRRRLGLMAGLSIAT